MKGVIMDTSSRHFLSGVSVLLILSLLSEKNLYGYEIIKQLEERSDYTFQYQAGSLYPVLYKLEKNEYIRKIEKDRRVYYSITPKGVRHLKEEQKEWAKFSNGVQSVLCSVANLENI
jgi:DNA-binding PadR family transcriptional regulator